MLACPAARALARAVARRFGLLSIPMTLPGMARPGPRSASPRRQHRYLDREPGCGPDPSHLEELAREWLREGRLPLQPGLFLTGWREHVRSACRLHTHRGSLCHRTEGGSSIY